MAKADLRDPENWIPRELFAAYVGPRSDDLLAYYDKAKDRKTLLLMSFSPLAVLMLPAWLGRRRQWALWSTFTGLIGVVPFIEAAIGIQIPAAAFGGLGVAMGFMARGLLLTNATGVYLKLKRQGLDASAVRAALTGRARSSVPLAFAGALGSLAVIVGLGVLAQVLVGNAAATAGALR